MACILKLALLLEDQRIITAILGLATYTKPIIPLLILLSLRGLDQSKVLYAQKYLSPSVVW